MSANTTDTPDEAVAGTRKPAEQPARPLRPERTRSRFWLVELYSSGIGKKYAMAISGIVLMGYVALHMFGNLKLYFGEEAMNHYGDWLRIFGAPALPDTSFLWIMRVALLVAFVVHIHASWSLTRMNRKARQQRYESKRDYVVADFAARTMRWTGVIVLLFVIFHLADLTFGQANPDFAYGDPYGNVVRSFERVWVSIFYIVANLALGIHLYHGSWSLFQSLGWNNLRFNHWRRYFAIAFAVVVTAGNVSFPVAVLAGVIS